VSGGTYRFAEEIAPLPAIKPPLSDAWIPLHRPDIEALRRADAPFAEVLEQRRSIRARGPARLTSEQLGELLFRSARVRAIRASAFGELSSRPYPGAGAQYELEIYPVVDTCEGLSPGLYHYCPSRHGLTPLAGETPEVRALLNGARGFEAMDVLLIVAARFQRIAWKYESIAYALILKDVGVLLQTIYLAATAMSLSPCAIGHGDPDLFCRAAGTDYLVEGSVGEMWLGGSMEG
jgi:SagB-type dehydrogenase family enzyme